MSDPIQGGRLAEGESRIIVFGLGTWFKRLGSLPSKYEALCSIPSMAKKKIIFSMLCLTCLLDIQELPCRVEYTCWSFPEESNLEQQA
jgi:hypothetical protein